MLHYYCIKLLNRGTLGHPIWVDDISKRLFPMMFLLFNIAYWSTVKNALTRQLNQPEENGFKRVAFDFEE